MNLSASAVGSGFNAVRAIPERAFVGRAWTEGVLMQPRLTQFSVVILGGQQDPGALNPDFLLTTCIVQPGWGWEVSDTLTTPPFAAVRYSNGVGITLELERLQIVDFQPAGPAASKAGEIAAAFVRAFPHVRYAAVGINFYSAVEMDSPDDFVVARFIKSGSWSAPKRQLKAAAIRLVYPLGDGGRTVLSLEPGVGPLAGAGEPRPVLLASANFHRDCDPSRGVEDVARHLRNTLDDYSMYCDLLAGAVSDENS